jgi:hypothetical protein
MKTIISIDFDAKFQNRPPWIAQGKGQFDILAIVNFIEIFEGPTTVFVREDLETIRDFGENHFYDLLKSIPTDHPLEIGWHPHIFGDGHLAVREESLLLSELRNILNQSAFARLCRLVRVGACQSGNSIMGLLSESFDIDSSAMSQCSRKDHLRWYDWTDTHGAVYKPSVADYRVPGVISHSILEVPITTLKVFAPYDEYPKRRILNPAIKSSIFKKSVEQSADYLASLDCLVAACHAEELESGYVNDLYVYGLDNFFDNLKFLQSTFDCEYTSFGELSKSFIDHK